jgi:hypothetical protein
MFKPKKAIPTLAASVLAIAGCASGDGDPFGSAGSGGTAGTGGSAGSGGTAGTGGGPTDGLTNALNAFCMKLVDCFPGDYADADECAMFISQYYGIDGAVSAECNNAAISYFDCATPLSCAELDLESNSCDAQATAAEQACGVS